MEHKYIKCLHAFGAKCRCQSELPFCEQFHCAEYWAIKHGPGYKCMVQFKFQARPEHIVMEGEFSNSRWLQWIGLVQALLAYVSGSMLE